MSVRSVSICVLNAAGSVPARADTTSDPDEIAAFAGSHAPDVERVLHESGILAIWLTRQLKSAVGRLSAWMRGTRKRRRRVGSTNQALVTLRVSRPLGWNGMVHTCLHSQRGSRARPGLDRNA